MSSILVAATGVLISVALSTAINWYLGPALTIRQERARHALDLNRELRRLLKELQLRLANEELQYHALEAGGQAIMRFTIRDYERLLRPAVRILDDPDLQRPLTAQMREGFRTLIGSWRLEYLTICGTPDLENPLDRYSVQWLEQRHIQEEEALIPAMCRCHTTAAAARALRQVSALVALVS